VVIKHQGQRAPAKLVFRGWQNPFEGNEEGNRWPPDTRSEMPYKHITQLPDSVKNNLPKHAQEIYKEAFNSAEEQYGEEDRAHRVAWSAVEQKYEKNQNKEWVSKQD
jgi:cation transport regulator